MPKIHSVSVSIARVPLDQVTSFATRTVSGRDYCLVKVRSVDGMEGIDEKAVKKYALDKSKPWTLVK